MNAGGVMRTSSHSVSPGRDTVSVGNTWNGEITILRRISSRVADYRMGFRDREIKVILGGRVLENVFLKTNRKCVMARSRQRSESRRRLLCHLATQYGGTMKSFYSLSTITMVVWIMLSATALLANDYFVSPVGNDATGDGSIGNPWRTIAYAMDRVNAGDVLYLRAGEYHEQLLSVRDGTASAYITISTYNNEDAYIDGAGVTSGNNGCLLSHSYMRFRGFTVRNWLHAGMTFSNCQFIELMKIRVTAVTSCIALKNTIHDFVVDSCTMYDYYGGAGGSGFDATPEGENDRIFNGVIQNSTAYLSTPAFDNCDGFALGHDGVSNIRLINCSVSSVGDGFDISGRGIVLERCVARNSTYGGGYKLWRDSVTLVNCVGYDNATNVELDFDASTGKGVHARLINCTLYGASNTNIAIELSDSGSTLELYNCILAGGDHVGVYVDGDNINWYKGDYNLFHMLVPERMFAFSQTDYSISQVANGEWTAFSGQDAHSKVVDDASTLFRDTSRTAPNLHIKAGSAAVNAGTALPDAPTVDFDGKPRNEGSIDIGAYEFRTSDGMKGSESPVIGFSLGRNYPNPFATGTTFGFHLSVRARVQLRIFDSFGRLVATVADEVMNPGDQQVRFEPGAGSGNRMTGLQPGVYFYQLTAGDAVSTLTMVVVR